MLRWSTLTRDLHHAGRRLVRGPSFSLFSVATLALAVGATTAVYAAIHALLGPIPGVQHIDRIVDVRHTRAGSIPMTALSWPDFIDLRDRQTVFDRLAGFTRRPGTLATAGQSLTGLTEAVGGEFFDLLGVQVQVGRLLGPADDVPGAPPAVVISDRAWERLFQRSSSAVGSPLRVDEGVFTVVGVAAPEFAGATNGGITPAAAWISLAALRDMQADATYADFSPTARERRWLMVKARLAPGRTLEQAQAELRVIGARLDEEVPIGRDVEPRFRMPFHTNRHWVAAPGGGRFGETTARVVRPVAYALLGATVLVLLVACTNLANLNLARWSVRQHDLAVRMALGASRWRVVREIAAESALLACAGGAAAIPVAVWLSTLLSRELAMGNGVTFQVSSRLDPVTVAVLGAALVVALLASGVVPALRISRLAPRRILATEGSTTTSRWRGRRYLIAAQVAVSAFLVVLSGVAFLQVRAAFSREVGSDVDRLAMATVDFHRQGYAAPRAEQLTAAILEVLDRDPTVERAAALSGLPAGNPRTPAGARVAPGGRDDAASRIYSEYVAGTAGVFEALGLSIVRGRAFDERDTAGGEPVVLLSEELAASLFDTDPLGREVAVQRGRMAGGPQPPLETRRVIGIVRHFGAGAGRGDTPRAASPARAGGVPAPERQLAVYVPLAQAWEGRLLVVARTNDPEALVATVQQSIRAVDPELGIVDAGTARQLSGRDPFYGTAAPVSAMLGLSALALALTGLYGVLSQVVRARSREIGIRRALGAPAGRIYRAVILEGLTPVLAGLIVGIGIGSLMSVPFTPAVVAMLVPRVSLSVLGLVAGLFVVAGILAAIGPARRAATVDPNVILRDG